MSNSLEPHQSGHFVGPYLVPNCLQRLSADDTSIQRVKMTTAGRDTSCLQRFFRLQINVHFQIDCLFTCIYLLISIETESLVED